jgi:hypothetical protein
MGRDGEIVGLASGESGRACESHEICGHHVAVGDLVKFKVVVLEEEGGLETKIKAVKIRDGTESCHIGFLPRHIVYGGKKEQITNKFGQVLELYKDSNDMTKKGRMIGFVVLLPFAFWMKSSTWNKKLNINI